MSGLLQRLAAQALGVHFPQAAPRVRSVMSIHAQVPVGTPREESEPTTGPRLLVDTPGFKARDSRVGNIAQRPLELSRPSTANHSLIQSHTITRAAPWSDAPRERASHAPWSDAPREHASHESAARIPEPLLDEVAVVKTPPAVIPIASAPAISLPPPDHSRTEPTEVHVHIRRIEVIAAPEPAAPKKSRAAGRNTLPLSDYLARRRQS